MEIPSIMSDLALILISASLTTLMFKWLKQPVILGYIVAGLLVGNQFQLVPTVSDFSGVRAWADIGVVFLLFALGLEFSFKKLLSVGKNALVASFVIIVGMILLGFAVGMSLGWGSTNSIMLGSMICMSSTTIIIKAFDDLDIRGKKFTRLVFGILIFEDLLAILLMVIISTMSVSKTFEGTGLVVAIIKLGFFLVIWLVLGIFFLPTFLNNAKKMLNDETLLIVALGLCFGMVMFATHVGFSSALGAFVMGSIFAETMEAERIDFIVKPVKDLFGAIFFVSVGMLIDLNILMEYIVPILIISASIVAGQIFFATCGVLLSGQSLKTAIQSGFSLTQVGEFAFIVASLGTSLGLIDKFLYPVIVAVSVITIFITPFMMRLADPAYGFIVDKIPANWLEMIERKRTSTVKEESVWKSLLAQILRIVCIYSVVIIAIIAISVIYINPFIISFVGGVAGQILAVSVSVLLMSPFIRALVAKKNHSKEYRYLWALKKTNWIPLVLLTLVRVMLSIGFISFVLYSVFNHVGIILVFSVSALLICLMMFSKLLKMQSIKLERRFISNLNLREHELQRAKEERSAFDSSQLERSLSMYDLHLADFTVSADAPCCGKSLIELNYRTRFGVHVMSIMRGSRRINIPGGKEMIFPCDKILALGTDEQLQSFKGELEFDDSCRLDAGNMKEVSLEQIEITKGSSLIGVSIRESGIRDSAKCMVVGIERNACSMVNPDVKTEFMAGDIVWIAGEKDKIEELRSKGTAVEK